MRESGKEGCITSRSFSGLPCFGITARVKAGKDHQATREDAVEQSVGKAPEPGSPNIAMDQRACLWVLAHPLHTPADLVQELRTQPRTSLFVPGPGLADLSGRSRPEGRGLQGRGSGRTTSSQERSGSCEPSISSMRLSSSSRWASVRGMASGVEERLSHSLSRRSSLSSVLRFSMSRSGPVTRLTSTPTYPMWAGSAPIRSVSGPLTDEPAHTRTPVAVALPQALAATGVSICHTSSPADEEVKA